MALLTCPDCGHAVSDQAPACPGCGRPMIVEPTPPPAPPLRSAPSPKKAAAWKLGVLGVLLLVWGGLFVADRLGIGRWHIAKEQREAEARQLAEVPPLAPPPPDPNVAALRALHVDWDWHLGGFDNVLLVTFRVRNENAFAVKDVVVECDAHGKSGTRLARHSKVIYDVVKAGGRRSFPEMNLGLVDGQAAQLGCAVVGFARAE